MLGQPPNASCPVADFNQDGWTIGMAIDANPGSGDDIRVLGPAFGGPGCGANCQIFGGSAILGIGDYYLNIAGTAGSTAGYGGNLATVAVGGVPETSTWAMMILGFLGVGFMAYRKRSDGKQLRLA
jgi:hypothetical protein